MVWNGVVWCGEDYLEVYVVVGCDGDGLFVCPRET